MHSLKAKHLTSRLQFFRFKNRFSTNIAASELFCVSLDKSSGHCNARRVNAVLKFKTKEFFLIFDFQPVCDRPQPVFLSPGEWVLATVNRNDKTSRINLSSKPLLFSPYHEHHMPSRSITCENKLKKILNHFGFNRGWWFQFFFIRYSNLL